MQKWNEGNAETNGVCLMVGKPGLPFWSNALWLEGFCYSYKTYKHVYFSDIFMSPFPNWIRVVFSVPTIYLTYKKINWYSITRYVNGFEIQHLKWCALYGVLNTFAISFCYLIISFCWNMFCNYNKWFNVVLNSAEVWLDFLFWPK